MDARTARRVVYIRPTKRIGFDQVPSSQVCRFWQQGRCNRNPCKFIHSEPKVAPSHPQPTQSQTLLRKRPSSTSSDEDQRDSKKFTWRRNATAEDLVNAREKIETNSKIEQPDSNPSVTKKEQPDSSATIVKKEQQDSCATIEKKEQSDSSATIVKEQPDSNATIAKREQPNTIATITKKEQPDSVPSFPHEAQKKLCQYWANGNCVHGDNCSDLHSWFTGSGFSFLAKLEGHNKAVSGVALPTGSDKLFSGSSDGTMCAWDCNSGQCVVMGQLGSEIGCVISEAPWVFAGLENGVMAWNLEAQTELHFSGANGLVRCLRVDYLTCTLFGGLQDGSILVWEATPESSHPVVVATYKGHELAVTSLFVGRAAILFSGSEDKTIRVWDRKASECLQVLDGHTASVTSVICWEAYLISGSLDNSVKIWGLAEDGYIRVVGEIADESGVLALRGINDKEANPILLCSRTDNTICLYNLPDCTERGRIFTEEAVQTIATNWDAESDHVSNRSKGGGLFFTGDATGKICVWRLDG